MSDDRTEPHGLAGQDKPAEPEDPAELVITSLPGGDPELMATCIVEEYALLGMGEGEILELFRQPFYRIHALYLEKGELWVRDLVRSVLARTPRLRVTVSREPEIGV